MPENPAPTDPKPRSSESARSTPRPRRPPKDADQKVKCAFCPRSFSTPRWNTSKNFVKLGFFNEADTLESSSILIYSHLMQESFIHGKIGEMAGKLKQ
jgi:hypothetical protein